MVTGVQTCALPIQGANKGEGLGNQFLSHIRETQAVLIVLRVFKNPDIIHVENSVDPIRDLEIINTELILKDIDTVEKRYIKTESEARGGKKEAKEDKEFLEELKVCLENGDLPITKPNIIEKLNKNLRMIDLNLLTTKRQIYLLNGNESEVTDELKNKIKSLNAEFIIADLGIIKDNQFENSQNTLPELIKKAYETLNLISFFTTGEDETRAWTITKGTKAPQASGVIHTDFENKFIRIETIGWNKLLEAGGWVQAKQKGWIRIEGKDYEVQDGDVIVVRHG